MESQDVKAVLRRETRRIAAAFGVEKWQSEPPVGGWLLCDSGGMNGDIPVQWELNPSPEFLGQLLSIEVGTYGPACCLHDEGDFGLRICPGVTTPAYNELMAQGLYRLGIEDESVLSQLPRLSAHEKLELRLSMPREFWPTKWLDEEAAQSS